jgi:hypothetical protein
MKSNEMTPAQMHELLKRNVFSDIDLERVASMDADQRRELKLSQIDKMLGMGPYADVLGWYISKFVDDDYERRADNPLYDEEDTPLVAWYLEVLELSYDLYFHKVFCLDLLAPGLQTDTTDQQQQFVIENQQLVDWLQQTPYRRVAAMVANIIMRLEFDKVYRHNDAVQDYYAENCSTADIDTQDVNAADTYINNAIEAIIEMRHHAEKGRQLGLSDEQMRVVDLLWSWVPHDYPEDYVAAAKEVIEVVDRALPAKTVIRSHKGFKLFYDQLIPQLVKVIEKYDLSVDLTDRYNLTMGYMYDWVYAKYLGGIVLDE